jgi:hypothetical protein
MVAYNYYDTEKGWENTNPKWYSAVIGRNSHLAHHDMVHWLYQNIDNPERHCRWIYGKLHSEFRFRFQKDYNWFILRWS